MARTIALISLFVGCKAFGNLLLAWGTKHFPQHLSANPIHYAAAMLNPFVATGIALLVLSLLVRLALLSVADLSFVLPVTSVGYVMTTLLGIRFLGETVTPWAWAGVLLIVAGAALAGSTPRLSRGEGGR